MNVLASCRGQPYADELRQLYDAAVRQQKQLSGQQQQNPAAAAGRDDDQQSITTVSTATTVGGALCWRCCGGRRRSKDGVTSISRRVMRSDNAGTVRGVGGHWSSVGDCESVDSYTELATASLSGVGCGTSAASVVGSLPVNRQAAALPDVVVLIHSDRLGHSQEQHSRPTANESAPVTTAAAHSARYAASSV